MNRREFFKEIFRISKRVIKTILEKLGKVIDRREFEVSWVSISTSRRIGTSARCKGIYFSLNSVVLNVAAISPLYANPPIQNRLAQSIILFPYSCVITVNNNQIHEL